MAGTEEVFAEHWGALTTGWIQEVRQDVTPVEVGSLYVSVATVPRQLLTTLPYKSLLLLGVLPLP